MINTIVFEDSFVDRLSPITTSRPAYAITCGSYRLVDLLSSIAGPKTGLVRPFLESLQRFDFPQINQALDHELPWTLLVNARMTPSVGNRQRLEALAASATAPNATPDSPVVMMDDDQSIVAAVVGTSMFAPESAVQWQSQIEMLVQRRESVSPSQPGLQTVMDARAPMDLLRYPHDVILRNLSVFGDNLADRIHAGHYQENQHGVFLGREVNIADQVVFDCSLGPVVIDDHVVVGPFSFLRGPIYIGPNSKVSEHASIKDEVSIGHTCTVGGEIEGTVIEPFSNKQHHGFLGHAYLGSWINLGAGTCNSDLKNTYGTVNMEYGGDKVSTGSQFVGCVMGDYSKTAINTSIFTGKIIGVGSMMYGMVTTNVPAFVNYARVFDQMGLVPADVIVATQKRMFGRRNREQRRCDVQLIGDMHRMTANERPNDLSNAPIKL